MPDWLIHPTPWRYKKVWKSWKTTIASTLIMDQHAMLLRTPSPITPRESVIYWNLQCCKSQSSHQDGWVTLHLWMKENYSISTGIPPSYCKSDLLKHNIPGMEHAPLKERRRWKSWSAYPTPRLSPHAWQCCLPWQRVWYAQPGQIPKAAVMLTPTYQTTSVILTWDDFPIQVPAKYLSFQP